MTGMLRPDAGEILLGDEDITALDAGEARQARAGAHVPDQHAVSQSQRARSRDARGVRARGRGAHLVAAPLGAIAAAVDEAHAILSSLRLGADCYRATRELPYGRQRLLEIALALATRPKVLLLDEPAAGVPRDESAELFEVISSLSRDITVLFIEHDMNFVFRFASRIIVMVGGRILLEGTPDEIAADPRVREVYLGHAGRVMAEPLLALERRARRLRRRGRARRHLARGAGARQPRGARPQRRRQVDAAAHHHGLHQRGARLDPLARRGHHRPCRRTGARALGLGWVAQEREIFPSLSVEENLTVAARPGRWDLKAVYDLFPRLAERRAQHGQPALRRRAADAGDRARADDQSGAAAARRAARRPRADHRRGADRRDRAA